MEENSGYYLHSQFCPANLGFLLYPSTIANLCTMPGGGEGAETTMLSLMSNVQRMKLSNSS